MKKGKGRMVFNPKEPKLRQRAPKEKKPILISLRKQPRQAHISSAVEPSKFKLDLKPATGFKKSNLDVNMGKA